MSQEIARQQVNHTRYRPGQQAGHYESFFQRANHPSRPLAFWIRYTLFSPKGRPEAALGELWAIYFDGETGQHTAVRQEFPFERCIFKTTAFSVQIGDSRLQPGSLQGQADHAGHRISWELSYAGDAEPLFLLPLRLYETRLPKAKSLVGLPLARFNGSIAVDGQTVEIADWVGSQNHNWGVQHTDRYAWGQVAGFDNAPDSFLEAATARLKFGPLWTPPITPLVLWHRGEQFALNALAQSLRAKAAFGYFDWHFRSESGAVCVEGSISARKEDFVGLRYLNPPGGVKCCLNSKIASCELTVSHKQAGKITTTEQLSCRQRAAFEILTDDMDGHGVPIRV